MGVTIEISCVKMTETETTTAGDTDPDDEELFMICLCEASKYQIIRIIATVTKTIVN